MLARFGPQVRDGAPSQMLRQVHVAVDESGLHYPAARVDHPGGRVFLLHLGAAPHRDDPVPPDRHCPVGEDAPLGVHGDDHPALDEAVCARVQMADSLICSRISTPTSSLQAAIIRWKRGPGFPAPMGVLLIRVQGATQYGVVVSQASSALTTS